MSKKKLFDNKTDWAILAFVIMAVFFGCTEKADAGEIDWAVEYAHDSNAGITDYNSGLDRVCGRGTGASGFTVVVCPIVAVRGTPKSDSFEIGIGDELWPRWEAQVTLNRFDGAMYGGASVRRLIGDNKFKMFIGGSYWIDESPGSNSNFTFNLGMRYTF